MLSELRISGFALIKEQRITFGPGLNVICGETGSGKSLVLQALELIVGGRAKAQFVRDQESSWEIEALFDLERVDAAVLPEVAQGHELVLAREQNAAGKGKVLINGRLGSVSMLQEISSLLINICRQGQAARLLESAYHLALLDQFRGKAELLSGYQASFQAWKKKRAELADLESKLKQGALRRAELEFVIRELGSLGLRAGLREELQGRVSLAGVAEQLAAKGSELEQMVNSEDGVTARWGAFTAALKEAARLDPLLTKFLERAGDIEASIGDLWINLARDLNRAELNQEELETLREELAEVARVERKYHMDCAALAAYVESARSELALLEDQTSSARLEKEVHDLEDAARKAAAELSASRAEAAKRLSAAVRDELKELGMLSAQLEIRLEPGELTAEGADRVEFKFCANKGERALPLHEVASGGELSRLLLVLKKVLRDRSGVSILVFDEVDSGISGAVARRVGEKLKAIAQESQVICITHLPQVASLADQLFLVSKSSGQRTSSKVELLQGDQKVEEIARMLAGYTVTPASRASARELLSSK